MPATNTFRLVRRKLNAGDRYRDYTVAAANTIRPGTMVAVNAAGLAVEPTATTGLFAVGWAEPIDGLAKGAGEVVRVFEGEAYFDISATIANIGDPVYLDNNQDVSLTATGRSFAGYIVEVDSNGALISFGLSQSAAFAARNLP